MSLEAGQTLAHYSLIEKIGEGGMGVVWKAHDTTLDRDVAIKVLPDELAGESERLVRFEREARAVAALNHPNIITVHSVEKDDAGLHFFTMELVSGKPLSRQIPKNGLPRERFLDLAIPLADAMSAAHEQGITHRDLKPANIMVTTENRVKVLDFGLAKLVRESAMDREAPTRSRSLTHDGQLMGTIPYMSPEQVEGRPIDHRSDLFSLGVILYEMATGRHPFPGETHAAVMSAILRDSPASVTEHNPELPADLGRIIRHCLQKDPERRYQTAKGLRNELQELLAEPMSETSATVPVPARRHSAALWFVLIAAAVVVGTLVGYFGTRRAGRSQPAPERIVVLPFENLGSPGDEYFAAGVTDEITSRLASLGSLLVVSHNSATVYERSGKTTEQIGRDLGVGFILDGTVRWSSGGANSKRVRIMPRLIRVADDTQMWSEPFDRVIDDIFAVQAEIAEETARRLGVTLLESEREAMHRRPTDDLDAYEAYLRGVSFTGGQGFLREDILEGIRMFERAVGLDATFALAYCDLSRAHSILYHYGYDHSPERAASAWSAVEHAIELAPGLPDTHFAMGVYYYGVKRDYERALQELLIAERGLPNSAEAKNVIASVWRRQGLVEESIPKFAEAMNLSPQVPVHARDLADSYYLLRRWEEAARYYDVSTAIRPDQVAAYIRIAWVSWLSGDTERARAALNIVPEERRSTSMWWTTWFWQLVFEGRYQDALDRALLAESVIDMDSSTRDLLVAQAYELLSQPDPARAAYESARTTLETRASENPQNYWLQASLSLAYAGLGRRDEAIGAAKRATELYPVSKDPLDGPALVKNLALIYAMLGEHEAALRLINELLASHYAGGVEYEDLHPPAISVPMLQLDPRWKPLWDHPRFVELVKRYEAEPV